MALPVAVSPPPFESSTRIGRMVALGAICKMMLATEVPCP